MSEGMLTQMQRRLEELREQSKSEDARHTAAVQAIKYEQIQALESIAREMEGLDHGKILEAEHVLSIGGKFGGGLGDSASVINDAIQDLSCNGGRKLKDERFGVKDYDRWTRQREDHRYGYGPRHGYTVFSVGLTEPVRKQDELRPEQIESAIYYLMKIREIELARTKAESDLSAVG